MNKKGKNQQQIIYSIIFFLIYLLCFGKVHFYHNNRMTSTQSNLSSSTAIKINHIPPQRTYHLIKKYTKSNQTLDKTKIETFSRTNSHNIFREKGDAVNHIEVLQSNRRPAGGIELFKKMEQITRESGLKKISKRSNKEFSLLNINIGLSRHRSKRSEDEKLTIFNSQMRTIQERETEEKQPIIWKEETYKTHQCYSPSNRRKDSQTRQTAPVQINSSLSPAKRPQTSKINDPKLSSSMKENRCLSTQSRWATEQTKSYQDKMALLNQINYNKPLLETYGNRYFEYTLRNRFQDELKPGSFIYQLDNRFTQNKVIDKIKKQGPLLKEKSYMKLQGHKKALDKTVL